MEIVIHRGLHLYHRENSIMAILIACMQYHWIEFDIIYIDNKWKLGHDINSYCIDYLEDLVPMLKNIKRTNNLIIDIKWDYLYSGDNIDQALIELQNILKNIPCTIYVQSIVNEIYYKLYDFFPNYSKGIVLPSCPSIIPEDADYIMADIHQWSKIELLRTTIPIFGYTCYNFEEFESLLKRDYNNILYGIVCDIPEN